MKTLRIAMIAAFVAIAMVSLANTDGGMGTKPNKKIVSISIQQAVQIPALVLAMYQQLNPDFLKKNQPTYTVSVAYQGVIVRITGTHDQWVLFFRQKYILPEANKVREIDVR
jgi:hypothetical protein